jgi:hypothetical protein
MTVVWTHPPFLPADSSRVELVDCLKHWSRSNASKLDTGIGSGDSTVEFVREGTANTATDA